MEALESLDLGAYEGTPLALERGIAEGGEWWATAAVAGLQFYAYGKKDELVGDVIPVPGDAMALMRRPENPADGNAVEVWWRNRFHLGHLPRGVASILAPEIDAGRGVRAYVLHPGDGEAWSLRLVLVGAGVKPLHGRRLEAVERQREARVEQEVYEGSRQAWPEAREPWGGDARRWSVVAFRVPAPRPPTPEQRIAADRFDHEREVRRMLRHADLLETLAALPPQFPPLPPGAEAAPDESLRGQTFYRWADVPPSLMATKRLKEHGLRPRAGAKPFATFMGYDAYSLFAVADCEPLPWRPRRPPEAARLRAEARSEFAALDFDA